jgi:ubiquinol-cytochrome c reductase cytochrome c1 subunit
MEDLGLPEEAVQKNLLFGTARKPSSTMKVAMRPRDASTWFGVAPPDLSVIARARGADWLYSYLLDYYLDPGRPNGVNNLTFPDTAMPHVLWDLQGLQRRVEGEGEHGAPKLELVTPGKLSPEQYQRTVADLVTFLVYIGEPAKLVRYKVGALVLVFLVIFTVLAYLLKKEYWKDVH